MINYKNKYIKYKEKYNVLKNNGVLNYLPQPDIQTDELIAKFNRIKLIFKKISDFTNWILHTDPDSIDPTHYNARRYFIPEAENTESTFKYNEFNSSSEYNKIKSIDHGKARSVTNILTTKQKVHILYNNFVAAVTNDVHILYDAIKNIKNTNIKQELDELFAINNLIIKNFWKNF
jgi:hypothetical protein